MSRDQPRRVSHRYFFRISPERLFEAFTRPEGLVGWLCDRAELDLRPGGRYLLGWTDGPTHTGTVLEVVPGRSLTLGWSWPGVELEGTRFTLAAEPCEGGALLRVEHEGFPPTAEWVDLFAGSEWGWTYFAMNLKSVLESGHDLRSPLDG